MLANIGGDTTLQDQINVDGYLTVQKYHELWAQLVTGNHHIVKEYLDDLRIAVGYQCSPAELRKSKRYKTQTQILYNAAKLVRAVNSFSRVCLMHVSCKSAKDRTAMAVTLHNALSLYDVNVSRRASNSRSESTDSVPLTSDDLHRNYFHTLIDAMRCEKGLRLGNVERNLLGKTSQPRGSTGKYAFNQFQLQILPPLYRPPSRVTNAHVTT